jgi:hypothetical protein
MAENQEVQTVTIDNVQYNIDDLSVPAKKSLSHLLSLEEQINKVQFSLEQLLASREVFENLLRENLPKDQEEEVSIDAQEA